MAGLALTLNIAEQALLNTQTELATSSNNISNANTDGYALETAKQVENPSIWTSSGWMGTGASITTISQARESFIEKQLMSATSSDSQYSTLASELTTIQSVASDSGSDGISEALGNFFDAWSSLAGNPTGSSEQAEVYSASKNLASTIQSTYSQLSQIKDQIPTQVNDAVGETKTLLDQIAQLNTAIVQNSTPGSNSNSLTDQQYKDMDSLSKLIPITFSTQSNGMVTVSAVVNGASETLVSGGSVANYIAATDSVTGGQLGGLLQAKQDLKGYMDSLDDFAGTLADKVNSVSTLSVFSGTDASSIAANSNFLSGETSAQLATITQNMSNLQDTPVTFTDGTSSTLQGYLDNIQHTIGDDVSGANTNQSFYDSLKTELQTQQQSVSGVSLDEEMVNVIQFQQIYQAAAKIVSTTSTLMNTAINMVR